MPDNIKCELNGGMMSVNVGEFNWLGGDLAIGLTQNRSSAVSGSWIDISTNETALQTWILLHSVKSAIYQPLLSFCKMNDDPFENEPVRHKEWSKSHMNKEDQDVAKIIDLLWSKHIFDDDAGSTDLDNMVNFRMRVLLLIY